MAFNSFPIETRTINIELITSAESYANECLVIRNNLLSGLSTTAHSNSTPTATWNPGTQTIDFGIPPGPPGDQVSLRRDTDYIQWRLGTGGWTNLVALTDLVGPIGPVGPPGPAGPGSGDMSRAMYDPNEVFGDAFDMDNMVEGETNKILTSAERTKLSGIAEGAQVNPGNATTSVAGLMSAADKTKLNGVATGATANSTDATLLDRANHTGSQAISTVTGLQTALESKADASALLDYDQVDWDAGTETDNAVISPLKLATTIAAQPSGWETPVIVWAQSANGNSNSITTPDFIDGYEYLLEIELNRSTTLIIHCIVILEDNTVLGAQVIAASANTQYRGLMQLQTVRRASVFHVFPIQAYVGNMAAASAAVTNNTNGIANYDPSGRKVKNIRINASAGTFNGGTVRLYRRKVAF